MTKQSTTTKKTEINRIVASISNVCLQCISMSSSVLILQLTNKKISKKTFNIANNKTSISTGKS